MVSVARAGSMGLVTDGGIGQRNDDRQAVGHDVVDLPGDPSPLAGGTDGLLLIAFDLEASGPLGQPTHVLAAGPYRESGEEGGHHRGGQKEERSWHRAGRDPAGGGQRRSQLEDPRRQQRSSTGFVDGHRIEGHQQRGVTDKWISEEPLDEGHDRDGQEDDGGVGPAPQQRHDQGGLDESRCDTGERRQHQPDSGEHEKHGRRQCVGGDGVGMAHPSPGLVQAPARSPPESWETAMTQVPNRQRPRLCSCEMSPRRRLVERIAPDPGQAATRSRKKPCSVPVPGP